MSNGDRSKIHGAEPLPAYWLNVEDLICGKMPDLCKGIKGQTATSSAPSINRRFGGELAIWDTFSKEVLGFWKAQRTIDELKRCEQKPIGPDPAIEYLNMYAMTKELIANGGEITLSGRFFERALFPILSAIQTMSYENYGNNTRHGWFPKRVDFGDSWAITKDKRFAELQPDVVMKLRIKQKQQLRLVGELKFCVTVNLKVMIEKARSGKHGEDVQFRCILGQIVDYMISHRLKHGFISTYEDTTFLLLDQHINADGSTYPCLYFSPGIQHSDCFDERKSEISLRQALLYLVHKTYTTREDMWKIPDDVSQAVRTWVTGEAVASQPLLLPRSRSSPVTVRPPVKLRTPSPSPTRSDYSPSHSTVANTGERAPRPRFRQELYRDDSGIPPSPLAPKYPLNASALHQDRSNMLRPSPLSTVQDALDSNLEDSAEEPDLSQNVSKLNFLRRS